ncbi:hypothetical protein NQ315_011307 [Exocentrus adspersus]|uniref:DDE Tnp4 domain-containing protein n=1 Tax=Exocentrus adspersus TaxID=1586481 RepID=A0AAV8VJW5_9CUCU|nr:hypothetical protein NQ315_011307 [Exocentrus adspersus]
MEYPNGLDATQGDKLKLFKQHSNCCLNVWLCSQGYVICSDAPNALSDHLGSHHKEVTSYSDKEFREDFRLSRQTFETILPLVEDIIKKQSTSGRMQINTKTQLFGRPADTRNTRFIQVDIYIRTHTFLSSIGKLFDMGKSSLSDSFFRIIKALNQLAPRIIKWPENINEVSRKFYTIAGMDGVIGSIDGTYIEIKAPQEHPETYITRKCNYAFTLQAICDNSQIHRLFYWLSRLLLLKILQRYFPNNEYIIGDKAYPVLPCCIPPYINRDNLTAAQINCHGFFLPSKWYYISPPGEETISWNLLDSLEPTHNPDTLRAVQAPVPRASKALTLASSSAETGVPTPALPRQCGSTKAAPGDQARPFVDGDRVQNFNTILSQTRQVIERAFALLFGRLRRLKFLDMNRTDWIPATVIAACVIHNLCVDEEAALLEQYTY